MFSLNEIKMWEKKNNNNNRKQTTKQKNFSNQMEKFATNQRFPRQKDEGLQFT